MFVQDYGDFEISWKFVGYFWTCFIFRDFNLRVFCILKRFLGFLVQVNKIFCTLVAWCRFDLCKHNGNDGYNAMMATMISNIADNTVVQTQILLWYINSVECKVHCHSKFYKYIIFIISSVNNKCYKHSYSVARSCPDIYSFDSAVVNLLLML